MAEGSNSEAKLAKLQKSSVDHLTCFQCKTYIRSGPINKCLQTLRTICLDCMATYKQPDPAPVCGGGYHMCSNFDCLHRNQCCLPKKSKRFLECELSKALRDMLPIPCFSASNGCGVVLFIEALEEHEKLCIFRKINCADYHCMD